MSVNNEAGASRQFVASGEAMSTGWIKGTKIWQAAYTVVFVAFVGFAAVSVFRTAKGKSVHVPHYAPLLLPVVLVVAGVAMLAFIGRLARALIADRRIGAAAGTVIRRPSTVKDLWRFRETALVCAKKLAGFLEGVVDQLADSQ